MTLPQYYRTVEEFTQPLTDTSNPVYLAGLRLEQCEARTIPCPFATSFRQHGDAARHARECTPALRSWTESTFLAALSADRPLTERQDIIVRYYSAYETVVFENAAAYRGDYIEAYMTIAKIGA